MSLNVTFYHLRISLAAELSESGSDFEVPDDFADVSDVDELKASEQDLNDLDKLIQGARGQSPGNKIASVV